MAGEQTQAFITKERSAGTSDLKIFLKMMDHPTFSPFVKKMNAQGMNNRQIAEGIGLNISNEAVDLPKMQQDSKRAQAKEQGKTKLWESGLLGVSDLGAGVVQGALYAKDAVIGGDSYKKFTNSRKDIEENHSLRRQENNQGFDWMRLGGQVAATAPMAALGRTYQGAKVLSGAGAKVAAQNAAVGAGIGASSFAKDADHRMMNTTLGGIGGAAGGAIGEKIGQGVTKVAQGAKNQLSKLSPTQTNQILQNIDQKLDDILSKNGTTLGQLSDDVRNGLRSDAKKILESGHDLNAEAVARKVLLERLGLKGTQAQLTGDPYLWNKQAELSKLNLSGNNPLKDKFIDDNEQLKSLLEASVAKTGGQSLDQYGAMHGALDAIDGQLSQNKDYIRTLYNSARQAKGNDAKLDGAEFVQQANKALDDNFASMSLPASVKSILNHFEKNPDDFTLGKSEEVIKKLNQAYQASLKVDGTASSETYAIGLVRDVLNNRQQTVLNTLANTNEAAQLYQLGRQAHGFNANQIESMPLLKDAVKGVEPDKLFSKHILNGNVDELSKTIQLLKDVNPQVVKDVKQQVLQFITDKSVMQSGQFSAANMRKAIDKISLRRLKVLFDADELKHITDIQKASHYLITQPAHSNINNSNTAATLMNHLGGLVNKPGVRMLLAPIKDVKDSIQVDKALSNQLPKGDIATQSPQDMALIDRLVKAGILGGANISDQ